MLKAGGCLASPSCPSDTFVPIGPCGLHAPPISNGFSLEKKGEGTFKTINTKDRKVKEIQPRVFPLLNPPPPPPTPPCPQLSYYRESVFLQQMFSSMLQLVFHVHWRAAFTGLNWSGPVLLRVSPCWKEDFFFPAAFAGLELVCSFSHTRLHTNKVKLQRSCLTRRRPSDLVPVPLG